MIGVCIPAHNEMASITQCVSSVLLCAEDTRLCGEPVVVVVVADSCDDGTAALAAKAGATVHEVNFRNVGAARAAGAGRLLEHGARWLAFTDADSTVSPGWLAEQLAFDADAVCGTVQVDDWTPHGEHADLIAQHFAQTYCDTEHHRHVHGANLGLSAAAYVRSGGFASLACSEDVALIAALESRGARIAWTSRPRVRTSARRHARVSGGFADALLNAVRHRLDERSALPSVLTPAQ